MLSFEPSSDVGNKIALNSIISSNDDVTWSWSYSVWVDFEMLKMRHRQTDFSKLSSTFLGALLYRDRTKRFAIVWVRSKSGFSNDPNSQTRSIDREKKQERFPIVVNRWLFQGFTQMVFDHLVAPDFPARGYFNDDHFSDTNTFSLSNIILKS